jgi:radical SAM superfamily enzyme YgiQ (UPF0313 family)
MRGIGPRSEKLILVMPPQPGLLRGFSTGLVSLANYVRAHQPWRRVEILDLSATPVDVIHESVHPLVGGGEPLIVGITTTTASYQFALSVARAFRWAAPNCTILFGGHHASADAATVLQYHAGLVDFVFLGESERSLLCFLEQYPMVDLVPGIAYLRDQRPHFNAPPALLTSEELDGLPLSFEGQGLVGTPGKFNHVTYVSARGCPLSCAFCAVANEKIRARTVGKVVEDIRTLVEMGYHRIAIEDNFFAHSPIRTEDLCRALVELRDRGVAFSWDCQTRVESMARPGLVPLFESAGCEAVYLGVEALTPRALKYLRKTQNPARYLHLLREKVVPALMDSSVECYLNLQFGLLTDTWEEREATLATLADLGERAQRAQKRITVFPQLHVVYPGTAHFAEYVSDGQLPADIFESFTAWESEENPVRRWLGEHFAHGTGGLPLGILDRELVRLGRYRVDPAAVQETSEALIAVGRLPGISLFQYGTHLVGTSSVQ